MESDYAAEGTLAHEYAARVLRFGPQILEEITDPEMAEGVKAYCDVVNLILGVMEQRGFGGDHFGYEIKIESKKIRDFGGTIDALLVGLSNVYVIDLKYGKGVAVEVFDNPQLLSYLLLVREQFKLARGTTYHAIIVQPRTGGKTIKQVLVSDEDLDGFEQLILEAQENPSSFKAGEHCRWCPALAICDTVHQHALDLATEAFPDDVNEDLRRRWAETLKLKDAITSYLGKLPGMLLGEIQKGHDIPGFKAVESLGNRAWKVEDQPELCLHLIQAAITPDDYLADPKVLSPPQLEKAISKEDFSRVSHLVHRPARGLVLAPSTDRREGVSFQNPVEAFDQIKE